MKLLQLAGSIIFLAGTVLASSGDRSDNFQRCVSHLQTKNCGVSPSSSSPLPLPLRITRWTCADNCKYICMHHITDNAIRRGAEIEQYYGKWPFWRLVGMQEPASVAFSLLNLWFHIRGVRQVRARIDAGHPMKRYYLMWAIVSMNAWVWSAVFHTRDLPITEKLDYFSAALAILYALYYTVIRMFHLYPSSQNDRPLSSSLSPSRSSTHTFWSITCVLLYLGHVSYLTLLPRFDYTYNMAFNLGLGLSHNALWLIYALPSKLSLIRRFSSQPRSYRPTHVGKAAIFVALTTAATALELFDFPPWRRIIDAHALWHLSTAPIIPFWYNFLIEDALDDGWRGHKM